MGSWFLADFRATDVSEITETKVGLVVFYLSVLYSIIMTLCIASQGLYRIRQRLTAGDILIRLSFGFVIGFAVFASSISLFFYGAFENLQFSLAFPCLLSFVVLCILHPLFFGYIDKSTFKSRAVVLGAGDRAAQLLNLKRKSDFRNVRILGYIRCKGDSISKDSSIANVLDLSLDELESYVSNQRIDEVIIAPDERRIDLPVSQLIKCKVNGVNVIDLIAFFERETSRIKIDLLYPSWLIFADGFAQTIRRKFFKRTFDILFSLLMLVCTSPIMLITALAIFLESSRGETIFYWQKRVGLNGLPFRIIKFRSMISKAEEGGVKWAMADDDRVTRVGKIIRKYRIDELPQLFNVLGGSMSFVGPRPERPEFVGMLADHIPYYQERHRVKPGITGWAQLNYPYGSSVEDSFKKLEYDLYYVKNNNLVMDIMILIETIEVVLFKKGSR